VLLGLKCEDSTSYASLTHTDVSTLTTLLKYSFFKILFYIITLIIHPNISYSILSFFLDQNNWV